MQRRASVITTAWRHISLDHAFPVAVVGHARCSCTKLMPCERFRNALVKLFYSREFCTSSFATIDEDLDRPATPWVRSVIGGAALLHTPKYNKGLAFTEDERDRLYLRGLLPAGIVSQDTQAERVLMNLETKSDNLAKLNYLLSLQGRNERLFFYVLSTNIEKLLPIICQPTISHYSQKYSLMFRSLPRALFVTMEDKGRVFSLLKNWPERRIKVICLTDGESVGPLGDLGVQGVGVAISKLALYTACGGMKPEQCLPICLDVGTDNEELLQSPFYVGTRHRRIRGDAYFELLDELLVAVRSRYGNSVFIHFQGLEFNTVNSLVAQYRTTFPCLSDAIHGTATAVLAGVLASLPLLGGKLSDQRILLSGDGPLAAMVAEMMAAAAAKEEPRKDALRVIEARKRIWIVDSKGLVVRDRHDSHTLEQYKLPFSHDAPLCPDLLTAVKTLRPTVLVGVSDGPPPFMITKETCEAMAEFNKRPLIMSLSSPSCLSAQDAYNWTQGRVIFSNREGGATTVSTDDGQEVSFSNCHGVHVFPGIGLGAIAARCTRLRFEMFLAAAEAVARMVTDEDRAAGRIFPRVSRAQEVSAAVARAVMQKGYESGVATELPKPHDLLEMAQKFMYNPTYRKYR